MLVHESTYTEEIAQKVGPGPQHSSAKSIAKFAELHQLTNLILTHFSARYQDDSSQSPCIKDIENEASTYFTGKLFLANDLDCYSLNTKSELSKII
ncbi:hypothetical protein [Aliikangiella sp. IMCC44359]|uniref:hypothetical protein n=1 Tax=Aliikangiella sp. IMCC44359 TaxID=3459125 RepID=UPI00403AC79F